MSEISDQLLKLIDAARAMAEHERRATVAYFLSLAADAAIDEKSPPAPAKRAPLSGGNGDGLGGAGDRTCFDCYELSLLLPERPNPPSLIS